MSVTDIDRDRLESLTAGEAEIAVELLEALLEDAGPLVESAGASAERQAWGELKETAHALKGISGNLGAARLREAAEALESAARSDGSPAVAGIMDEVRSALERVRAVHAAWAADPAAVFAA